MKKRMLLIPLLFGMFLSACGGGGDGKSDFTGVEFASATYTYDGNPHILGKVTGVPEGTTITYTGRNEYVNAGTYNASAKLVKEGYHDKTLNATLTINKANISATLASEEFSYDGSGHSLEVEGDLPTGAQVSYSGNGPHTDAGTYPVRATVTAPNHNDLVLNANLVIAKVPFSGITFESRTFEYDGTTHSIQITGTLPTTASVTYSSDVQGVTNSASDIGTYNVTATITDLNHITLDLTATLKIKTNDEERLMMWSDDTLYFQNALDDNKLYVYNSGTEQMAKANLGAVKYMDNRGSDKITFTTNALITGSIGEATYDSNTNKVSRSSIISAKANSAYVYSSNIVYYAINGLINGEPGVYKADLSGDEAVITRLYDGKASHLTYMNMGGGTDRLYFIDEANGDTLCYVPVSGGTKVQCSSDKIVNLYKDGDILFYTVNKLLGNYIESRHKNGTTHKITSDAGIDMCVISGYLYYINADILTSLIQGEGIYKVNAYPVGDNSSSGTKIVDGEDGLCSLCSDGTYIYYYDMNGYKLVKANTSGTFIKDLLEGFVKPDDPTPMTLGGDLGVYNGVLYYIDVWDNKTLHYYNPNNQSNVRLTADKVDNFTIEGDYVYMNSVSWVVNNDTYRFNALTGVLENINNNSGQDFVIHNGYVYYARDNGLGVRTAIHRTNLSTLEDEEVYTKGVSNLRLVDNKLCFIDGYQIFAMDLTTLETTELTPGGKSVHTDAFDTDGTSIYYRDQYNFGYALKRLAKYNLRNDTKTIMVVADTDPIVIYYHDGYVYYYNDISNDSKDGLYRVRSDVTEETTPTSILPCDSTYYAETIEFIGNKLYFLNYHSAVTSADSHIYEMPITGGNPSLIA